MSTELVSTKSASQGFEELSEKVSIEKKLLAHQNWVSDASTRRGRWGCRNLLLAGYVAIPPQLRESSDGIGLAREPKSRCLVSGLVALIPLKHALLMLYILNYLT